MTHDETPPPLTPDSAWAPINIDDVLNGTYKPAVPTCIKRSDGVALGYPGLVNSIHGESESMKSMITQAEAAREISAGRPVCIVDFESDQATVVNRLLMLGASPDLIRQHLSYIRPDTPHFSTPADRLAWDYLLKRRYSLFVIDGITEAFAVYGVKSIDNDEVTAWGRQVPRQIADRTGACVLLVDHVTKSAEGRGRFAIGAQAKMSYLTGASYSAEVIEPGGVGMIGKISLRIGKDRPGQVRPHGGTYRKSDRSQEIAVAIIDSSDHKTIKYSLVPPRDPAGINNPADTKLADVMDAIIQALTDAPSPLTFRAIQAVVRGRADTLRAAITELTTNGHITTEPGPRNSTLHRISPPYLRDTLTTENAA